MEKQQQPKHENDDYKCALIVLTYYCLNLYVDAHYNISLNIWTPAQLCYILWMKNVTA